MKRDDKYDEASELLRALAAPLRIAIVLHLASGPSPVSRLVDAVGAPQPLVSQHLKVLRAARVVRGVRHGREIHYELVDNHVSHIVADAVQHAAEAELRAP